ncbi:glycoside hydrolase family 73 protein [Streptococcus pacificus]|uniref:Glucosaminidase domain-containing protein n=1 Tax=Streptococcus pacificus TaxID=2740577 RepID=A0ABS0ZJL5_9STRE|nr:glucosaminidase domain-containing protein [Streptococcus pacificus]MBJ8326144.1 glucosaminidase domain-containing protein [Streptococcus pacificus]
MRRKLSRFIILIMIVLFFLGNFYFISSKPKMIFADKETMPTVGRDQFIQQVAPKIQEVAQAYGLRPSVVIAQALISSKNGTSYLARNYHNLFGLLAKKGDPTIKLFMKEYDGIEWKDTQKPFKIYSLWEESLYDYMLIIQDNDFWGEDVYSALANARDYQSAANLLQDIGFSNDPEYATKIINLIDEEDLTRYDQE